MKKKMALAAGILATIEIVNLTRQPLKEALKPMKIKIRRTWGLLRPVTKVKQSKKLYRRVRASDWSVI